MSKSVSVSESGHAKNVANLGVMNSGIAVLGTKYNPSNPNIAADLLVTKKGTCELAMKGVTSSNVIYQNAVIARNDEYHKMGVLTTRINNAFGACGATDAAVKNMASLKSKVEGERIKKLPTPPVPKPGEPVPEPAKTNSVSQMGFDNRKSNFEKVIAFITAEPKYTPNEPDLKVVALNLYVNSLAPLNDDVNNSLKVLQHNKELRNIEIYAPTTGIVDLSRSVKKYVKSIDGANSPASKNMAKIRFTNFKP